MVRFLVLYDRPQDVQAFERHYREVRRYSISRNIAAVRGGDPYFLVGELEWDDMASLRRAFESDEGKATAADMQNLAGGGVRSMVFELEDL